MRCLAFIFMLLWGGQVGASSPSDLRGFGEKAPAQLYLFTSLTCPYCAHFHRDVFPSILEKYVDTGKVQLIIVDVIRGKRDLLATLAIRCLEGKKADRLEHFLYDNQEMWGRKDISELKKMILEHAKQENIKENDIKKCMSDSELQKTIISQQENLAALYKISGFPSLIMRKGLEVHRWEGGNKKEIMTGLKEALQE